MRVIFFFVVFAFAIFIDAGVPQADSGFGDSYFAEKPHPGFTDPADTANLEKIEPAAGMESNKQTKDIGQAEEELEQEYDTDVTRSVIDRSASDKKVRDRMGDEQIGIFYEHSQDQQGMGEDDAIGVDIKLLEFQ